MPFGKILDMWQQPPQPALSEVAGSCQRSGAPPTVSYSSTLSSNFFRSQSAAACTNARTTGCGFFSLEDSCG